MKNIIRNIILIPLDLKLFIFSIFTIVGIFIIPDKIIGDTLYLTYIVFIFISSFISGFYFTYVGDSEYNYFRNINSKTKTVYTIIIYVTICFLISYILVLTNWFLFLIS